MGTLKVTKIFSIHLLQCVIMLIQPSSEVEIHFKLSGRDLAHMDPNLGKPDAFAVLTKQILLENGEDVTVINEQLGKSTKIDEEQDPFWPDDFSVTYEEGQPGTHRIAIELIDEDYNSVEKPMGWGFIHIHEINRIGTTCTLILDRTTRMGRVCFTTTQIV